MQIKMCCPKHYYLDQEFQWPGGENLVIVGGTFTDEVVDLQVNDGTNWVGLGLSINSPKVEVQELAPALNCRFVKTGTGNGSGLRISLADIPANTNLHSRKLVA